MAKKTYEDFYKENRKTKPIVSGSSANRYQYNKSYYEYLAHLEDLTTNYNKKLNPKDLYNFPTLSNPDKVTKADIIAAQEAVFELQKKKAEIELQNEWRRSERERKKNEYLEEKAAKEEAKLEAEQAEKLKKIVEQVRSNPLYPKEQTEYVPDDYSEEAADDAKEMIANLRKELQAGENTKMCELMEAILDTAIGEDFDGLIDRLYGVDDYVLDLASRIGFDSNPGHILDASVRLAEKISGSTQYNQTISDELQVWKKENPKAHSTSSSRARNDDY